MKKREPLNNDLLCYPPHDDDDWRLCDGATNQWMGTIENMAGDEILDLAVWCVKDFGAALEFAKLMVREHNLRRFGVSLGEY